MNLRDGVVDTRVLLKKRGKESDVERDIQEWKPRPEEIKDTTLLALKMEGLATS